jgi:phage-related protein
MATEVGTAYVRILPTTQGFSRALQGGIGGQAGAAGAVAGKRFGGGLLASARTFIGPLAAAFGAVKTFGFLKDATLDAEAAKTASNRLANTLRNAGDATGTWAARQDELAETLGRSLGIEDETIKAGQAVLATFQAVGREAGKQSGVFDRATQAAIDLAAAGFGSIESNSVQLGKALQDPVRGLTALRRSGVDFTESQQEQIKALVESGDLLAAQRIILANVEGQVGGTAVATTDASARMKAAWGELKESVGRVLLPAFERFANFMADKVLPGVEALLPRFQRVLSFFTDRVGPAVSDVIGILFRGDYSGGLVKLLGEAGFEDSPLVRFLFAVRKQGLLVVGFIRDRVVPAVRGFVTFLGENSEKVAAFAAGIAGVAAAFKGLSIVAGILKGITGAVGLLGAALTANPIGIALVAIGALVGGLIYLYNSNEGFRTSVQEAWSAIGEAVQAAWTRIQPLVEGIGQAWSDLVAAAGPLRDSLADLWVILQPIVTAIAERLAPILGGLFEGLIARLQGAVQVVTGIFQTLTGVLTGDGDKIKQGLTTVWEGVKTAVVGTVRGLVNGIVAAFRGVGPKVGATVQDIGPKLGEWWAKAWRAAGNAVKLGVEALLRFVATIPGGMLKLLIDLPGNLRDLGLRAFTALLDAAKVAIPALLAYVKTMPDRIAANFTGIKERMFSVGTDIVRGLVEGIKSFTQWAIDQAKEFAANVVAGIKDALGISSPSKVFMRLGTDSAAGFVKGLDQEREVRGVVARLTSAATPRVGPAQSGVGSSQPGGVNNSRNLTIAGDVRIVQPDPANFWADLDALAVMQ